MRHLPGAVHRSRDGAQRGHRARRAARSCCSPTPTSSRRPICSRGISSTIATRAASPSSAWRCRSRLSSEYSTKRDQPETRRPLHPPARKRLSWLYFLTGNASVRRDDLDARRVFRRELHRIRSRGSRTRIPLERAGDRRFSTSLAPSIIIGKTFHTTNRKKRWSWPGARRCAFTESIPHFAVQARSGDDAGLARAARACVRRMPEAARASSSAAREALRVRARCSCYQYHYVIRNQGRARRMNPRKRSCGALRAARRRTRPSS